MRRSEVWKKLVKRLEKRFVVPSWLEGTTCVWLVPARLLFEEFVLRAMETLHGVLYNKDKDGRRDIIHYYLQ